MIPVTVHGAEGRMGRLVGELVEAAPDLELVALITEVGRERPVGAFHPSLPLSAQSELAARHPRGGVIVDFSLAPALDGLLVGGAATAAALVIGTTGHDEQQMNALQAYARDHAVVMASNFSIGIPALKLLLEKLAEFLPMTFQPSQVETHHRHKVDRPSGTARTLARAWSSRRGGEEVPTHSLRVGGVPGDHRWIFCDDEEQLVIEHRALSRRAFLRGVAPAIRFVAAAAPGLYTMEDVLSGDRRS